MNATAKQNLIASVVTIVAIGAGTLILSLFGQGARALTSLTDITNGSVNGTISAIVVLVIAAAALQQFIARVVLRY